MERGLTRKHLEDDRDECRDWHLTTIERKQQKIFIEQPSQVYSSALIRVPSAKSA